MNNDILNNLNVEKLNLKELTILLEILEKLEKSPKDDIEVI